MDGLMAVIVQKPGPKEDREVLKRGLHALRRTPPEGAPQFRTAKEAKRWLLEQMVTAVIRSAGRRWEGRLGSGEGAGNVSGIPATAGSVGFEQWVVQETLKHARGWLRDYADSPPDEELVLLSTDYMDKRFQAEDEQLQAERMLIRFGAKERWFPFVQAWCQCDEEERLVWLADHPGMFGILARVVQDLPFTAAERAAFTITPQMQEILGKEKVLHRAKDLKIKEITGVKWLSRARSRYVEKIANATGVEHKQLGQLLRDYGRS
jgi:hypothetical protein